MATARSKARVEAVMCSRAGVEVVACSGAGDKAVTCSGAGNKAAACSKAGDKAATRFGARIEDGRWWWWRNGFLGDSRARERGEIFLQSVVRESA
jgi:hypothetical protein